MHILAIPSWYPTPNNPHNGNFVQRHLELIAENHQLSILNFISDERSKVEIVAISHGNATEYQVYYPKKSNKISQFISLRKAFLKVVKQIKQVDLIHLHVMLDKGLLGIWAKKHFTKPLIVTEHGSYFFRQNYHTLSVFQKMTIIQVMKQANKFSCVSEVLKEEINYLFPRKKIELTPNVIDTDLFTPLEKESHESINFIHISNLGKLKNVPLIIQAFEKLNLEYKNVQLTLVAEVRNPEIEAQIAASPVGDRIHLTGPLSSEAIADKIQQADALVMLSDYETFSCVIAESWACGKAVISTSVGIAKNLDPKLGIQVEENNSEALRIALKQFIQQKDRFQADEIRGEALPFSKQRVLESFESLYQR